MEQVTGFKTKDNKFFVDKSEALAHEREIAFINWYKNSNSKFSHGVTSKIIIKWLQNNRESVLELLEGEEL